MPLVANHRLAGPETPGQFDQPFNVLAGGQRDDLEPIGITLDQVERRATDRPGRAEDGDAARGGHAAHNPAISSKVVASATASSPSSRSSTPPWPGRIVPLSLTPARRLTQLS